MKGSIGDRAAGMHLTGIDQYKLVAVSGIIFPIAIKAVCPVYYELYYIMIVKMTAKAMMGKRITGEINIEEMFASPEGEFGKGCLGVHQSKLVI